MLPSCSSPATGPGAGRLLRMGAVAPGGDLVLADLVDSEVPDRRAAFRARRGRGSARRGSGARGCEISGPHSPLIWTRLKWTVKSTLTSFEGRTPLGGETSHRRRHMAARCRPPGRPPRVIALVRLAADRAGRGRAGRQGAATRRCYVPSPARSDFRRRSREQTTPGGPIGRVEGRGVDFDPDLGHSRLRQVDLEDLRARLTYTQLLA